MILISRAECTVGIISDISEMSIDGLCSVSLAMAYLGESARILQLKNAPLGNLLSRDTLWEVVSSNNKPQEILSFIRDCESMEGIWGNPAIDLLIKKEILPLTIDHDEHHQDLLPLMVESLTEIIYGEDYRD